MSGGRDYNTRRPPRRKSWEDESENTESENRPYRASDYDPKPDPPMFGSAAASDYDTAAAPRRRSTSAGRAAGRRLDIDNDEDDSRNGFERDRKERAKTGRKRLLKLLGNEVLCLVIIFGLIGTFNWIATDYSGDYLGQSRQLRSIQLTVTRRATTIDAELNYGASGLLELDPSHDHPAPKDGKPITLYFSTPEQWRQPGRKVWKAVFAGKIDGGKAIGTISDTTSKYKVVLEKNVLTSLFSQAQAHIPRMPAVPLPSLFDETDKSKVLLNTGTYPSAAGPGVIDPNGQNGPSGPNNPNSISPEFKPGSDDIGGVTGVRRGNYSSNYNGINPNRRSR